MTERSTPGRTTPTSTSAATTISPAEGAGSATTTVTGTSAPRHIVQPDRTPPSSTAPATSELVIDPRPPVVAAGEVVELWFPLEQTRVPGWFLYAAGDAEAEPSYLLLPDARGWECDYCPAWLDRDQLDVWGWNDVNVSGPGPDTVLVPDTAAPGTYRLCLASTIAAIDCVEITVTA